MFKSRMECISRRMRTSNILETAQQQAWKEHLGDWQMHALDSLRWKRTHSLL